MIIKAMACLNGQGQFGVYKVLEVEGENIAFKDKFVKIYLMDKSDAKEVESLVKPLLTKERKSVWFTLDVKDNPTKEERLEKGLKNVTWTAKEVIENGKVKYGKKFFIRKIDTIDILPF